MITTRAPGGANKCYKCYKKKIYFHIKKDTTAQISKAKKLIKKKIFSQGHKIGNWSNTYVNFKVSQISIQNHSEFESRVDVEVLLNGFRRWDPTPELRLR